MKIEYLESKWIRTYNRDVKILKYATLRRNSNRIWIREIYFDQNNPNSIENYDVYISLNKEDTKKLRSMFILW